MKTEDIFWGGLSLCGGISYFALAFFLYRNVKGLWMHICLTTAITLLGIWGTVGGLVMLLGWERPLDFYRVLRLISAFNGIIAMLAVGQVLKEPKKKD